MIQRRCAGRGLRKGIENQMEREKERYYVIITYQEIKQMRKVFKMLVWLLLQPGVLLGCFSCLFIKQMVRVWCIPS